MRLIDADALEQAAIERYKSGLLTKSEAETVADMALNAPTIDPVKHGWWLLEPYVGKHATLKVLRCSECDNPVTELPDGKDYNYCPNCGARMDGGEERETD